MLVNFKNLLPRILREGRWGEYVEAFQAVIQTVRDNKIDIIKDQYDIETMTDTDVIRISKELGYDIYYADGYTETTEYLKRQLLTVIPRISNKNNAVVYNRHISNIYNLDGTVYPTNIENSLLWAVLNWYEYNENDLDNFTLDLPAPNTLILDSDNFLTLDQSGTSDALTRHIVYNYNFNYVESSGEFMSQNTANALYYDCIQNKRKTEVLYFEPELTINTASGEITDEVYTTWDRISSGCITSNAYAYSSGGIDIYDLSSGATVRFGEGEWSDDYISSGSITDVNDYQFEVDLTLETELASGSISSGDLVRGASLSRDTASMLHFTKWMPVRSKAVTNFSELAVLDSSSACIYYAKFPMINFSSKVHTNVAVNINLI